MVVVVWGDTQASPAAEDRAAFIPSPITMDSFRRDDRRGSMCPSHLIDREPALRAGRSSSPGITLRDMCAVLIIRIFRCEWVNQMSLAHGLAVHLAFANGGSHLWGWDRLYAFD